MTTFWWAKALKASHMEQARGHLNAFVRTLMPATEGRVHLELAFGHIRAVSQVEDCVDAEKGYLRWIGARDLSIKHSLAIGEILAKFHKWEIEMNEENEKELRTEVLLAFDNFEEKHRTIIYS